MTRTVVVTGATSGIGRAAAREFAARGDRLVLAARAPTTLAQVRAEGLAAGGQALAVPTDVYDALVGPLMRLAGLSRRRVGRHDGVVFAPNRAGEAVRGGWNRFLPIR
ncbi:SDR family NAD(P)-dependent oxidoreductase [Micromonospora haikouensis]